MVRYLVKPPTPRPTGAVRREVQATVNGQQKPLVEVDDFGTVFRFREGTRVALRIVDTAIGQISPPRPEKGPIRRPAGPALEFVAGDQPETPTTGAPSAERIDPAADAEGE